MIVQQLQQSTLMKEELQQSNEKGYKLNSTVIVSKLLTLFLSRRAHEILNKILTHVNMCRVVLIYCLYSAPQIDRSINLDTRNSCLDLFMAFVKRSAN